MLAHVPAAGARAQVIYVVGVLGRRPRIPAGCAGPLRALICECWQRDARARPPFATILLRLRAMQARVARTRPSLNTHLWACLHTGLIESSVGGERPLTCALCCMTGTLDALPCACRPADPTLFACAQLRASVLGNIWTGNNWHVT